MRNLIKLILLITVFCVSLSAVSQAGNVVVIVNLGSGIAEATAAEISKVFMGKSTSISGEKVEAVDQVAESESRADFSEKILGRSVKKVTDYWKKRVFSGKGEPLKQLDNDAKVIAFVSENPGSIGYIASGSLNDKVKAIKVDGKIEW